MIDREEFKEHLAFLEKLLDNKRTMLEQDLPNNETSAVRGQIAILKTIIADVKDRLNTK